MVCCLSINVRCLGTYGYRQGDDEHPAQRTEAAREFAQECLGLDVVTHGGQSHQPPPDAVIEGPVLVIIR